VKIRTGILIGYTLIIGLGFYLLVRWILDDLQPRYLEAIEEVLVDTSNTLAAMASSSGIERGDIEEIFDRVSRRRFRARIYERVKTDVDLRVYITDAYGIVTFDSDGDRAVGEDYSTWRDVRLTLEGRYGARASRVNEAVDSTVLYVASPIIRDGQIDGVLTVCKPTISVYEYIWHAKRKIVQAAMLAGLAVIAVGIGLSYWVTWPIEQLTQYARAVRDGKRRGLRRQGQAREVRELGEAFEEMRSALEGKHYVENYVQTLTHEIKSPISAIRGAAELLEEEMPAERRKRFLENIRAETERIAAVSDKLLSLSSVENLGELENSEEINFASVVKGELEGLRPLWSKRKLKVKWKAPEQSLVWGDRFLLGQAVANLLQNAIEFSPEGGCLGIHLVEKEKSWCLQIEDDGPGIPDYAREKVFERFYSLPRPETQKKSSGLGLTFVREIAALHGGRVLLENRDEGGARAVFCLLLPDQQAET
jgi:two-component system sensor histidine kinase CreC